MLRCPDAVPPETRQISGGEFSIGRGSDNDWALRDPDRVLSKRHCLLAFRSGGWQLADLSANGTFLNRDADPVGPGAPRDLRDGDRLVLGSYEIEIRIVEEAAWQGGGGQSTGGRSEPGLGAAPSHFADPFGDDPFAPPRQNAASFQNDPLLGGARAQGGFGAPNVMLPDDYDPLAPDPQAPDPLDSPFRGPTQSDHAPALEQAFRTPVPPSSLNLDDWDLDLSPPASAGSTSGAPAPPAPAPPAPPGAPPGASVLDDWDIDLSAPPSVAPVVAAVALPIAVPPAEPDEPLDPFAEPERDAVAPPRPPPGLPLAVAPPPAAPAALPVPPRSAAAPVPSPQVAGDLMAAFLRGAGMQDVQPSDPVAAMEQLGRAFRALVTGLRQALIARAAIKGEFRIEQTMIRARGNNPLKFSAGDDDALAALLGVGRRTDMAPADAIAEALGDMRLHELASMAAMQTAVRALVQRFDPAPLRAEGERAGGLLGAQKRARAFELFEKLHGDTARALADDFDSVFGKAFARAYEQALREVADKETNP